MTKPLAAQFPALTVSTPDPQFHLQPFVQIIDADSAAPLFPEEVAAEIVLAGELHVLDNDYMVRAEQLQLLISTSNGHSREVSPDYRAIRISTNRAYIAYCVWPNVSHSAIEVSPNTAAVFTVHEPVFIRRDADKLLEAINSSRPFTPMVCRQLAKEILQKLLLTETPAVLSGLVPDKEPGVPEIGYFMEANFNRKLSVQQLADAAGRSLSAFKRDFAQMYKVAPLQWLINRRLEYAFYLIRYTDYSIPTIAHLSGFSEHSGFAAAYKDKFGVSPLQSKLKGV